MSDLFQSSGAVFDIAVLSIVVVSAVMSLGRGLVREASSVLAFIVGGIVAAMAFRFLKDPLYSVLPDSWPPILVPIVLIALGFLAAYSLAAFIGSRLSRLIHSSPEIGLLDRLAGAAFGVARGLLAIVVFILLLNEVMPEDAALPSGIAEAQSYRILSPVADWIRHTIPGFVEQARDVIALPETGASAPGN